MHFFSLDNLYLFKLINILPFPQLRNAYGAYYFLTKEAGSVVDTLEEIEHDYEEPYFEPATEEEGLLQQLLKLSIPVLEEETSVE